MAGCGRRDAQHRSREPLKSHPIVLQAELGLRCLSTHYLKSRREQEHMLVWCDDLQTILSEEER